MKDKIIVGGRWLYFVAVGVAIFSGFGQMPIYKRYYINSIPGLGWSENYVTLSQVHYLAAALLVGIIAWRLTLAARRGASFTWGPRTAVGWILLALVGISGGFKMLRNAAVFIDPFYLMMLDFIHLGSAMTFAILGIYSLIARRGKKAPAALTT